MAILPYLAGESATRRWVTRVLIAILVGAFANALVACVHAACQPRVRFWPSSPVLSRSAESDCYNHWEVERCQHGGTLQFASNWDDPDYDVSGSIVYRFSGPDPDEILPNWADYAKPHCGSHRSTHHAIGIAAGWPFMSMWGGEIQVAPPYDEPNRTRHFAIALPSAEGRPSSPHRSFPGPDSRLLPLAPLWRGFIWNTLVYALALSAMFVLVVAPFRLRRYLRIAAKRCPACGYPRGVSGRCTECAAVLEVSRDAPNAGRRRSPHERDHAS